MYKKLDLEIFKKYSLTVTYFESNNFTNNTRLEVGDLKYVYLSNTSIGSNKEIRDIVESESSEYVSIVNLRDYFQCDKVIHNIYLIIGYDYRQETDHEMVSRLSDKKFFKSAFLNREKFISLVHFLDLEDIVLNKNLEVKKELLHTEHTDIIHISNGDNLITKQKLLLKLSPYGNLKIETVGSKVLLLDTNFVYKKNSDYEIQHLVDDLISQLKPMYELLRVEFND